MRTILMTALGAFLITGCKGPEGPAGEVGPDGAVGATGIPGATGPTGPTGAGEPGVDGEDGDDGENGEDGVDGEDGEDGEDFTTFTFRTDDPTTYTRVDRMGMPAVATAVITNKDDYNAGDPADDGDFALEIIGNLDAIHTAFDADLATLGLVPCTVDATKGTGTCVDQAAPLVIPDVLKIDTALPEGFANGRTLTDPVIDITLAAVLLELGANCGGVPCALDTLANLPLNPPANDKPFMSLFPYLAAPHM